jgi:hypothetical protein
MPATFHSGVGGKLMSGAVEFAVLDWQFTTTNKTAEVTNSGSLGWEEHIPTVTGGSGTANCVWDSTNMPETGVAGPLEPYRIGGADTVALKLYCGNSTKFYSFNAIIESLQVSSNAVGSEAVKFSVNFKATGAVTAPV